MSNFRFELISSHKYGDGHYAWASAIDEKKRMRIQVGTLENDYYLYSEDLGNSWIRTEGENNPSLNYKQLKDGSYISLAFNNLVVGHINIKQDKIPCIIKIVKAECMDDILSGNINVDFALIDIPDLSVGYGDSGGYHCSVVDHGLIQLEDGSLIATMYGQFKSDIVKVDYFDEYDFYQYRSWCIKSNDNGKTWELSLIHIFTVANPVIIILSAFIGWVCFKEKLKKPDYLSLGLALLGILVFAFAEMKVNGII